MDEEITKPASALLKLLLPIDIILVVITLFTSLFIIIEAILSSHGIILNFSNYGHSMDPTIKGNALVVIDTRFPFDELQPGDIISFKERPEHHMASASITMHISKAPENAPSTTPGSDKSPESDFSDSKTVSSAENAYDEHRAYHDENINYLPNRAVLHRIVAINTVADRALITKGDGNEQIDGVPVLKSGYIGKMLWHIDYIGEGVKILYENFTLIMLLTVVMTTCTLLLRQQSRQLPGSFPFSEFTKQLLPDFTVFS